MPFDHDVASQSAPVVVAAQQPALAAPLGDYEILSMQRTAGNRAVGRAIGRGLIQRDDEATASLTVAPQKASIPLSSGTAITAAA